MSALPCAAFTLTCESCGRAVVAPGETLAAALASPVAEGWSETRCAACNDAACGDRSAETGRAWLRSLRIPPGRVMLWCAPGSLVGGALLLRTAGIVPKDCTDTIILAALLGHGVLAWILAADQEGRIRAQREAWRAGGGTVIEGSDADAARDRRIADLEARIEAQDALLHAYGKAWAAIAPLTERPRHLAVVPAEAQEAR